MSRLQTVISAHAFYVAQREHFPGPRTGMSHTLFNRRYLHTIFPEIETNDLISRIANSYDNLYLILEKLCLD